MVIFWNFAGVPFVSAIPSYMRVPNNEPSTVLRVQRRLYGISPPKFLRVVNTSIRIHLCHLVDRVFYVRALPISSETGV